MSLLDWYGPELEKAWNNMTTGKHYRFLFIVPDASLICNQDWVFQPRAFKRNHCNKGV